MASDEPPVEGESGSSLLLNQPVVIDNGTSSLKAGFAGSSKPKVSAKRSLLNFFVAKYSFRVAVTTRCNVGLQLGLFVLTIFCDLI